MFTGAVSQRHNVQVKNVHWSSVSKKEKNKKQKNTKTRENNLNIQRQEKRWINYGICSMLTMQQQFTTANQWPGGPRSIWKKKISKHWRNKASYKRIQKNILLCFKTHYLLLMHGCIRKTYTSMINTKFRKSVPLGSQGGNGNWVEDTGNFTSIFSFIWVVGHGCLLK